MIEEHCERSAKANKRTRIQSRAQSKPPHARKPDKECGSSRQTNRCSRVTAFSLPDLEPKVSEAKRSGLKRNGGVPLVPPKPETQDWPQIQEWNVCRPTCSIHGPSLVGLPEQNFLQTQKPDSRDAQSRSERPIVNGRGSENRWAGQRTPHVA